MWKIKLLSLLILLGLVAVACTPAPPQVEDATPSPQEPSAPVTVEPEIETEQVVEKGGSFPAPVRQARQALAVELGLPPGEIQIQNAAPAQWPDTCLGLPRPEEVCAEVITEGYGGTFLVGDEQWEYRVDTSGEITRFVPGAVLSVRQILSQQLQPGLPLEAIRIIAHERLVWPDSCLGVVRPDVMCSQVETPGYRIILEFEGKRYEYHTDETGGVVVLAEAPDAQVPEVAVKWELQGESGCQSAQIGAHEVVFGPCEGPLISTGFVSPLRASDLAEFVSTFASFEADTPAGRVTLQGTGSRQASASEQRMVAEWARLVFQEAESGRSGASWGLVLAWHREGGIAGFCNDLTVYLSGEAYAASCGGETSQDLGRLRLSGDQLAQIYAWVDQYKSFEVEQKDPPVPDQMIITLTFSGAGEQEPDEAEKSAILEFAAQLYSEIEQNPQERPEATRQ